MKCSLLAQDTERTIMLLGETKVSDTDIYKKNYPAIYNWSNTHSGKFIWQRGAHVSEAGFIYTLIFFKGDKNFGEFVATQNDRLIQIRKDLKEIVKENNDNTTLPLVRSAWVGMNKLSVLQPDFKIEDYDFRKMNIFTVPSNKTGEYESLLEKVNEADKASGIKYNVVIYKAEFGYPVNTYMALYQDKSRLDYYKHQDERNATRKINKERMEMTKKMSLLQTMIRVDHLDRIPNQ